MHFVNTFNIHNSTKFTSPALNRSSVIPHFKHSDAIKICDGIISTLDCRIPIICLGERLQCG